MVQRQVTLFCVGVRITVPSNVPRVEEIADMTDTELWQSILELCFPLEIQQTIGQ